MTMLIRRFFRWMKRQEIHESCGALFLRVSMSPSSSSPRRQLVWKVRLKRGMSQSHASWSSKDWNSRSNWQRSAVEGAGQSSQDKWKSSKHRAKWKEIRGRTGYTRERKEKHLGQELQRKFDKRNRNVRYIGRYGGRRQSWRRWQRQTQESLEETPRRQGRGKSGTRTLGRNAAKRGCRELEEFMYSRDREIFLTTQPSARKSGRWCKAIIRSLTILKVTSQTFGETAPAGVERNGESDQRLGSEGRRWESLGLIKWFWDQACRWKV